MTFSLTQGLGLISWLSAIHDVYGADDPYDTIVSNKNCEIWCCVPICGC